MKFETEDIWDTVPSRGSFSFWGVHQTFPFPFPASATFFTLGHCIFCFPSPAAKHSFPFPSTQLFISADRTYPSLPDHMGSSPSLVHCPKVTLFLAPSELHVPAWSWSRESRLLFWLKERNPSSAKVTSFRGFRHHFFPDSQGDKETLWANHTSW